MYPDGFVAVYEPLLSEEKIAESKDEEMKEWLAKKGKKASAIVRKDIWDFMNSSTNVLWYEKVEVPESFSGNDDEEVIKEAEAEKIAEVKEKATTAAERRKQTGTTIISVLSNVGDRKRVHSGKLVEGSHFTFNRLEYPIAKINDWREEEVYYANEDHSDLLQLVGLLTRPRDVRESEDDGIVRYNAPSHGDWTKSKYYRLNWDNDSKDVLANSYNINSYYAHGYLSFFDCKVKLIKIAQSNNKLYRDFKHVTSFFAQIKNNTITMSNTLIKWNTARVVREKLLQCSFLFNFEYFDPKLATKYQQMCNYIENNYRHVNPSDKVTGLTGTTYEDMISHLDSVQKFQEFVRDNGDTEAVTQMAHELFGNKDVKDGMAVQPYILDTVQELVDYALTCGDFLNHVGLLTGCQLKPLTYIDYDKKVKHNIPGDLEVEIRKYLEFKGALTFGTEQDDSPAFESNNLTEADVDDSIPAEIEF
jgi:hypothetical protein